MYKERDQVHILCEERFPFMRVNACDPENFSESQPGMYTGENRPNEREGKPEQNFNATCSEQSLVLEDFSKKQAEMLYLFISSTWQAKKMKTICGCTESTYLIYRP